MRYCFRWYLLGLAVAVGLAAVAPSAVGQTCPSCLSPYAAPAAPVWQHRFWPLPRPAPAPLIIPSMPEKAPEKAPEKEPEKAPDKEPPAAAPPAVTQPSDFTGSPAAGTETGAATGSFANMFGAPFGGGSSNATIGSRPVTFTVFHPPDGTGGFFTTVTTNVPFAGVSGPINIPDPAGGGVVGRQKPTEDANPLPRDRFIFNYDYFSGVPLGKGTDVNRYFFGFEKTFFGGLTSLEVRLPIASTMASDLVLGNQLTQIEMGDLALITRILLYNDRTLHVGGGLCAYLPTGRDVSVAASDGTPLVRIPNRALVLSPFLGALVTPNDRFFAQGWISFDIDTNGDPVQVNALGNGLVDAGRLRDPLNLGLDLQLGYWVYRSGGDRLLTGLIPFIEAHYTSNLEERGLVSKAGFVIPSAGSNTLDLTAGLTTVFGRASALNFGVVFPLRQDNRNFTMQFGVHANFFFGPRVGTPASFVSTF